MRHLLNQTDPRDRFRVSISVDEGNGMIGTVTMLRPLWIDIVIRLRSDNLNGLDRIVRLRSRRGSTMDAEILIKIAGG